MATAIVEVVCSERWSVMVVANSGSALVFTNAGREIQCQLSRPSCAGKGRQKVSTTTADGSGLPSRVLQTHNGDGSKAKESVFLLWQRSVPPSESPNADEGMRMVAMEATLGPPTYHCDRQAR